MVWRAQLFYVSIFRQNFDSILILLIGSPLQFGFAAPPTPQPTSWVVSLRSVVQIATATMSIKNVFHCWKYERHFAKIPEGTDIIVQCRLTCRQDVGDIQRVPVEPRDTSDIWRPLWVLLEAQHCRLQAVENIYSKFRKVIRMQSRVISYVTLIESLK